MSDTTGSNQATTQPEFGIGREVEIREKPGFEVTTSAQCAVGTIPSDLPETAAEGGRYVFRVGMGRPLNEVIITIDTRQITEQARVKKVNQAIRRANQL